MLDMDTKRRIDAARDLLVGKVPDPKSQVEQITIALIYKFMDDIDAQSEEWGGARSFFAGEFARYGWAKLLRGGLGGHQMLALYAESLAKMPENPGIPPLFRNIFNNAYLPYRDPETLRAFLKIIDEFQYDHSERLGDAFEYLLAVLGAQGDAGQFRTPRHIIDFIVNLLNPHKHETILDPACGTAGFLISSYKHIRKTNVDDKGDSTLTPDDKGRLAANFKGYDISPDMVRLSLVNMYLHGFVAPQIYEYDTLTSEERWRERADVILANPPFMSPKGGIRPHSRFSIRSKRSEVLFVDYIAEHLTANGRAGIIVPEGIIFQSQSAYKQLRKLLVEKHLAAVISLPAGVFQPYSGVKTSILILDGALARQRESVAFFKVESDGYDLGAQRRPIEKNDLPQIIQAVKEWQAVNIEELEKEPSSSSFILPKLLRQDMALIVKKSAIAATGDYNLSQERYKQTTRTQSKYPMARLGEVCAIVTEKPKPFSGEKPYYSTGAISTHIHGKHELVSYEGRPSRANILPQKGDVGFAVMKNTSKIVLIDDEYNGSIFSTGFCFLRPGHNVLPGYLFYIIANNSFQRIKDELAVDGIMGGIRKNDIRKIEIPLPPIEVQRELVHEIENHQRIIDAASQIVKNYSPRIPINPSWPLVQLGDSDLFLVESGGTPKSDVKDYWDGGIPWITLVDLPPNDIVTKITKTERTISEAGLRNSAAKMLPANSVVVSSRATIGRIGINRIPLATNQGFKNVVIKNLSRAIPEYIALTLTKLVPEMQAQASGSTYKEIIKSRFSQLRIPLPPLKEQKAIVAEIEAEQSLVNSNRELANRMEKKIQLAIARVWKL